MVIVLAWAALVGTPGDAPTGGVATPALRVVGRHYVDATGRVVLLRGVNLSGDAKLPPFLPLDDPAALDPLPALGINTVRLLFIWEAYEPEAGRYDEGYLGRLVAIARAAWSRGMYVVVDFHQDGLSRWASRGCGAGFPAWALAPSARVDEPRNGCGCRGWVFHMLTDRDVHRSFAAFYADAQGARTRYLQMLGRVAGAFAACPGVIGYDLFNEPWGDESRELAPLYRDAADAIRPRHPGAILFVAGHGSTSCGLQTRLPRPEFDNFAYAPHYYDVRAVAFRRWDGGTRALDRAFVTMCAKAEQWNVPLFVGEFGIEADVRHGADYVAAVYDRLDQALASGTQWNYTPRWNERDRDGWNGEDYSILDHRARVRTNYRPRPYPQKVAGRLLGCAFRAADAGAGEPARFWCSWQHDPSRGATEVYVPATMFPADADVRVAPPGASWTRDPARHAVVFQAPRAMTLRVTITAP